jgi:hypothetical protein
LKNGELFKNKFLREFRERQYLDELMTLHDIVLFDTTALGTLLEFDERQCMKVHVGCVLLG